MRRQVIAILLGLVLACVGGLGQDSKDHDRDWNSHMDAGKAAMEKRQYADAEQEFRDALSVAERHGKKDARYSGSLLSLAQACDAESKRDEAEVLAERAVESMEKALNAVTPTKAQDQFMVADVASTTFDKAGDIFAAHQKYADAEPLYRRVIKIRADMAAEKQHPQNNEDFLRFMVQNIAGARDRLASANEKLGNLYFTEHKYSDAAAVYEEAVRVRDGHQTGDQRVLAQSLTNLATCYAAQGKYDQADLLYQRALAAFEQAKWSDKPETIGTLQLYALMLKQAGRDEESKAMLEKAAAIRKKLSPKAP